MITSTILTKERIDDTLFTAVRYDFTEEVEGTVTVNIPHFRPQSEEDINNSIVNRGLSERDKLIAINLIELILPNL